MVKNTIDLNNFVVRDIFAVNDINHKQVGKVGTRKNRPFFSLAMKMEGKTIYKDEKGESFLADKDTVILISKGSSYRWTCKELGECIMVEIVADYPGPAFSFMAFKLNEKNSLEAHKLFNSINRRWKERKEGYMYRCKSDIYKIFATATANQEKIYTPKSMAKVLQPAIDYMTLNLADATISNQDLATLCNVSVVYFRKLFDRLYGVSPIKYLRMLRIEKAKELLVSDYLSISDIASMTGFNTIFTFSRAFKNEVGLSPKNYLDKMGRG